MTFTKACFIRKNTPELRNKLKELGYEPSEWVSDDNELCLATGMDKFITIKTKLLILVIHIRHGIVLDE